MKGAVIERLASELARCHHDWCDFRQSVERGEAERLCDCWLEPLPASLPLPPESHDHD